MRKNRLVRIEKDLWRSVTSLTGPALLFLFQFSNLNSVFAASAMPVGMPGGMAVGPSVTGAAAGFNAAGAPTAVNPLVGSSGTGLGNPINGPAYVPATLPTFAQTNFTGTNPYLMVGSATCPFANQLGLMGNTAAALAQTSDFGARLEDRAFSDHRPDYYPGTTPEQRGRWSAMHADPRLNGNCKDKFITPDGKVGKWGNAMLAYIKEHADVFNDTKTDMKRFCPAFGSFSDEAKARYWIYVMELQANQESRCNESTPKTKGVVDKNGVQHYGYGLLMLEPSACNNAGVPVGAGEELLNPLVSLKCGVAVLAKELSKRDTMTASGGTYWAGLRSDIQSRKMSSNREVASEGAQAQGTQAKMTQFTECSQGENKANDVAVPLPPSRPRGI